MQPVAAQANRRILVIDDNMLIHEDFRKILEEPQGAELDKMEAELFGAGGDPPPKLRCDVESAFQGREGVLKAAEARNAGCPFEVAFVDMRMPPGWDGVETIERLWQEDRDLQVVICTAYSDYSWAEIHERLGGNDRLLILKKPFDNVEVCQLACALTEKYHLTRKARMKLTEMEEIVQARTAELHEANQALRREIEERRLLEEERIKWLRLEHEKNHLEDAVRALKRVLGIVGHEVRTPLSGARTVVECLLAHPRVDDTIAHSLTTVREQIVAMSQTINDLLEVARLTCGTAEWNWSRFYIREIFDAVLEHAMTNGRHNDVPLNTEIEPPDLSMRGDAGALQILLQHLLTNAREHTTQGTIRLRIFAKKEANEQWVHMTLSDTGTGMSPAVLARVGVPFALSSGVTGESYVRGSGLGLVICTGIVSAHGGTISVSSAQGEGTMVHVRVRADLKESMVCHIA